jgi:hypothetical protein
VICRKQPKKARVVVMPMILYQFSSLKKKEEEFPELFVICGHSIWQGFRVPRNLENSGTL